MHFSVFLKSFDVVHDKLYYFVLKLIERVDQRNWFMCWFLMFLIKLHKADLKWPLCLEILMTF